MSTAVHTADVPGPAEASAGVGATYTSTAEPAHGPEEAGGLPQFEFEHWGGQIIYLLFLFAVLYLLIAKVFAPRMRRVFDERAATIATAIETARQVQAEAAGQAEAAKAEVDQARAESRKHATAARTRVTEEANRRQAAEEAKVSARIADAETAIGKTRDKAMSNVAAIAEDTAAAMVRRLTGAEVTPAQAAAAVKGV